MTRARVAAGVAVLLTLCVGGAGAQVVREDFHITNGTINSVVRSGNTLYLGGNFTSVGATTGAGAPIDASSGLAVSGFPVVAGQLTAVVPDGAGGWFIGGLFTSVGGVARSNLAHILADNSVAAWNPGASGQVLALVLDGSTLYVGGTFASVDGQSRSNLAAVDTGTGAATAWNPGASSIVRTLALGSGVIYAGGGFTSIGATTRNRIAAISTSTGSATSWNPNAGSTVRALVADGSTVFAGGDFATIGGQSRSRIAALDAGTGLATAWNPGASAQVSALALDGATLYVGGSFTTVAGQTRNRLAAIGASTGSVTGWNPNANGQVVAIAISGSTVYAGGDFLNVGGQARSRLAALSASSALATSWNPSAYGTVAALAVNGGIVYAGGSFTGLGGSARNNLAAIDIPSGLVTAWNPGANSEVLALALDGGTLYAGGSFTSVAGQTRNALAAFDASSGTLTAWDPNVSGRVDALATDQDRVYAGGFFSAVGGQARGNLAMIDASTGTPGAWTPSVDGEVFSLAASGGVVYVGGTFMSANGVDRMNLAAVNASTGALTSWDPQSNGTIRAIDPSCGKILIGGFFTTIGPQARQRLAAIDATTGLATSWNPNANGPVFAIARSGRTVYVAGVLSSVGGQARNRLAAIDLSTGLATPWNPNSGGTVRALALGGGSVYAGGMFSSMGSTLQTNIAAISEDNTLACPTISLSPGSLATILVGAPFAQTLTPLGGSGPYCLALTDGSLPPGVAFDAGTGQLSGTPSATGSYGFTVTATDANGCTGSQAYTLVVGCPAIAVTPPDLPDGSTGAPYSQTFVASAGTAPLTWSVGSGSLPDGLSLAPTTGVLSGTPTGSGTSIFSIQVTDAYGCVGSTGYTVDVFTTPPASVVAANTSASCISLQHPCVPVPFVFSRADSIPARGVSVTFQIDVSKFSLCTPGSPAASVHAGAWLNAFPNSNLQVVDNGGGSYTVDQAIFGTPCGVTTGGVLFTVDLKAAGSDGTGTIVVTKVKARDCSNVAIAASPGPTATLTVHNAPIVVLPASLPDGPADAPYTQTLTASPGTAPFTFTVTAGTLPPGLVLSPGGEISGTPTSFGSYAFTVTATDAGGCTGSRAYNVTFSCPAITVLPPSLPNAVIGLPYSQTITHDGGTPPFSFVVTSGSLPAGLTLTTAGVLSGTPTVAGAYSFTITVTAAGGCSANQPYSVAVSCPALAVLPSSLEDGVLGEPFNQSVSASAGIGPFAWSVTSGTLPAGLLLSAGTGEISGTPTVAATSVFTIGVADAYGCTASETYTLSIFAAPPSSSVAANADSLCLSTVHACVSVPFFFARGETAPARGVSVSFQLQASRLALCTPGTPAASVHLGSWLAGYTNTQLEVVDHGGGSYTVDLALFGSPCGVITGGQLFTVDVQSVGGDGYGTIAVTGAIARDCDNVPIGVLAGPVASLSIQHAAPAAITDLASEQVTSGNGPGSTTGITVTWATGGGAIARLYRAPFGAYPLYDANGPVAPPDPVAAPGAPWTLVSSGAVSGYLDHPPSRGWWHYVAFAVDSCGNSSAVSNLSPGSLDYHLGDVSDGVTVGLGNNQVGDEDVSLLGANYGIGEPAITTRGVAFLDVGPTTDWLPTSRPLPDHQIDFEDFMLFAANYQVLSAPPVATRPARGNEADAIDDFRVIGPAAVSSGENVTAWVWLSGSGRIQGFSAELGWDAAILQPVSAQSTPWLDSQNGLLFSPRPGKVDAVLLGARAQGMLGTGELAAVTFQAIAAGPTQLRMAHVVARDARNQSVPVTVSVAGVEDTRAPLATALSSPWPNPARGDATLEYSLARAGQVELALYGVDGRRVRVLERGTRDAGAYRLPWDGTDEGGQLVPPGLYYVRLRVDGQEFTKKLVRLER